MSVQARSGSSDCDQVFRDIETYIQKAGYHAQENCPHHLDFECSAPPCDDGKFYHKKIDFCAIRSCLVSAVLKTRPSNELSHYRIHQQLLSDTPYEAALRKVFVENYAIPTELASIIIQYTAKTGMILIEPIVNYKGLKHQLSCSMPLPGRNRIFNIIIPVGSCRDLSPGSVNLKSAPTPFLSKIASKAAKALSGLFKKKCTEQTAIELSPTNEESERISVDQVIRICEKIWSEIIPKIGEGTTEQVVLQLSLQIDKLFNSPKVTWGREYFLNPKLPYRPSVIEYQSLEVFLQDENFFFG